tara:strand:- start:321 stop:839 length:519 start_codon:yes stop_codon:yes gene_type:complete
MKFKKRLDEIIRVDHAGEYGAQQIYSGQIKFTKDKNLRKILEKMAKEEHEHLKYFESVMLKKRIRPTLLGGVWKVGGFSLGALTALLGKNYVMACTEAVEDVIVKHYENQLNEIPNSEEKEIRKKIKKFVADEDEHRETGASGINSNDVKLNVFKFLIKGLTKTAIRLSEKI